MSVHQVVLSDDGARIYVDTAAGGQAPGGRPFVIEMPKLFPLVVPNCILAGRGNPAFLAALTAALHIAAPGDFDAIAANLGALAGGVHRQYTERLSDVMPKVSADQEMVLIGWSHSRQRMAGVMCFVDTGALEPECIELFPGDDWLTPWGTEWGPEPASPADDAAALALAREQVRLGRATLPGVNFGGRLLCATVTRGRTTVHEVGSL